MPTCLSTNATGVVSVANPQPADVSGCALVVVTGSEFKSFLDSASMWPPLTVADSLNVAVPILVLFSTAFAFRLLAGFFKTSDESEF